MRLATAPYREQSRLWPAAGRHILAQFDEKTIIVYQAYSPAIGQFAAANGFFGGEFSYARMSWVKPNFLWMMYRSDWGRALGQEVVLAVRLRRVFFEGLLARAFCHEIDHLNGILFIQHLSLIKRDLIKRKIRKLMKRGEW